MGFCNFYNNFYIPVWTAALTFNIIDISRYPAFHPVGTCKSNSKDGSTMLTVMELLSFPLFRNFKLVSGYGGLYNQVSGTGIFEWESSYEVEKNFDQGEFVVTTLSLARSDTALAEASIRMLIDKRVSAIAVKDIYFHEISEELKAYSDAHQIPVFFFSETFFDDIIYTIKNTLLTHSRDFDRDEQVEFLLDHTHSAEQKKRKAKEINPFFHSNFICCFASLKKGSQWQKELKALQLNPEETVYSIINYQHSLLVIYTTKDSMPGKKVQEDLFMGLEKQLIYFLEKSGLKKNLHSLGISDAVKGLENLGMAIQECLYANSSCRLNQKESLRFCDSGLDQILLPMGDNPWAKKYYNSLLSKITSYDALHRAKLMETLLEYVGNNGDMKLTAQKLYQHSNTIRYRIDKIRKLLSLTDDADSFAQLILFVRLHEIYQYSEIHSEY